MREVAQLSGVSLKTVSRVINGESGVREPVREAVLAAVERLDYRPNLAASNLRRGSARTLIVGALVQDLSNSFSATLLRTLEDTARLRHTAILASSLDEDPQRETDLVRSLVERRVDGLILVPTTERQDYLAAEQRAGLPLVFVDRQPRGIDADSVTVDNTVGGRLAAAHLLDHGHRRIAVLLDLGRLATASQRRAGVDAAHAERGLRVDPTLVRDGLRSEVDAQVALRELLALPDPPTAVFAGRNAISTGAVRAIADAGLAGQVALVGFDDFPLADLVNPPLTVIRQNVAEVARIASEMLFERIDGLDLAPRSIVLTPTLVPRGSGEIRPPA